MKRTPLGSLVVRFLRARFKTGRFVSNNVFSVKLARLPQDDA